jgi:hypothetical protein
MSEIDPKEHERLKEELAELRLDVGRLLESAYWEIDPEQDDRPVVGALEIQELQSSYDRQMRDKAHPESKPLPSKYAPNIEMREVLEWFHQPDHAIGSNAEKIAEMEKKVRWVLGIKS